VRVPFRPDSGTSQTVSSGASGLLTRVFCLSMAEVGYDQTFATWFPIEGARMNYFIAGDTTDARNRRIGRRAGSDVHSLLAPNCSRRYYAAFRREGFLLLSIIFIHKIYHLANEPPPQNKPE